MVEFRPVCLDDDTDFVLEMFVIRAFESASDAVHRKGLREFREQWLGSSQAGAWLRALKTSLRDRRTIAEVVEVNGTHAGMVWATFAGPPYEPLYAELRMIAFRLNFQRQGLGRFTVYHLEELAAQRGATSIRSTGSAQSEGIRRFHASLGFQHIQTVFEKAIEEPPAK